MISDFGLSKIGPTSLSYVVASVKGTFGYLDPEYFYTKKLTKKTDVYVFGVVLFELLSGRLPVDTKYGDEQCSLVRWAQKCVKERKLGKLVDSTIRGTIFPKCLRRFAQIAHCCLLSVPRERPTMTEVVVSLQNLLVLQEKFENTTNSSGTVGFTWKIHKYLVSAIKENSGVTRNLRISTFDELSVAVSAFSEDRKLGTGRYGDFYKVCIDKTTYSPSETNTGTPVVIMLLHVTKFAMFENPELELEMLNKFSHPNLLKLIGYSLEKKKLYLAYEFVLDNFQHLLDSGAAARLPLVTKVKIAVGIARGIVFLNEVENYPWTFTQLNRHEIFLDEDFTAKLSGYDIPSLRDHIYLCNIVRGYNNFAYGDYYPGHGPVLLHSNLSGFTVVFVELLTGKQIYDEKEIRIIDGVLSDSGQMSLSHVAKVCFEICNERDSESKVLTMLTDIIGVFALTTI